MAYRLSLRLNVSNISISSRDLDRLSQSFLSDAVDLIKEYAVGNLSGIPFTSKTGTHVINKRTGVGAASVQTQSPYGSPFRARIFASAMARYANAGPECNYLDVLERGRGKIVPRYTSSVQAGFTSKARLTVPGGSHQLVNGQKVFRGVTGRYSFVKEIPPMEGKYWMQAAVDKAMPEIEQMGKDYITDYLNGRLS